MEDGEDGEEEPLDFSEERCLEILQSIEMLVNIFICFWRDSFFHTNNKYEFISVKSICKKMQCNEFLIQTYRTVLISLIEYRIINFTFY